VAFKVLNNVARMDIHFLQSFAKQEQSQLYHILSILLPFCTAHVVSPIIQQLLEQVLLFVGYYCVLHHPNQDSFIWGQSPTLLQHLCNLPFYYFSDEQGKDVLFPTLIAVSFASQSNRAVLSSELSTAMLVEYVKAKLAKLNKNPQAMLAKRIERLKKEGKEKPLDVSALTPSVSSPLASIAPVGVLKQLLIATVNCTETLVIDAKTQPDIDDLTPTQTSSGSSLSAASSPSASTSQASGSAISSSPLPSSSSSTSTSATLLESVFSLARRFPVELWEHAISFFENEAAESTL